jgi:dienelactone hydrolase
MPISLLQKISPTKDQQEGKTPQEIAAGKNEAFPELETWMGKHHPQTAYPLVQKFLSHLRTEQGHKNVGVVGFCWGGWHAVHLTHKGEDPSVEVAVACSPELLTVPDDFEKVEKPLCLQVGDLDDELPPSEVKKVETAFRHKYKCAIHVYDDQVHGFASRGDLTVAKDRLAKETAAEKVKHRAFNQFTNSRPLCF